ncbi:Hypothetical predicted protein [Lecanosticta acicola]|uniref:BTB domain-containing protein n=1 Tax=Lecanosticta acicola TaxID=111012 RepID=A0AAI9EEN7_9PEZI|nr:Hypothetical predicted protein [Lecanosticta acicola]
MADNAAKLATLGVLGNFFDNYSLADFTVRKIDLSDHDTAHVRALLEYIYKSDYNGAETVKNNVNKMVFHVNMCFVGDKYDISELKNVSTRKFQSVIGQVKQGNELAEVSRLAYSGASAVRTICDSIVDYIFEKDLVTACSDNKQLEEAMEAYPRLAIDLIKIRGPKTKKPKEATERQYCCPNKKCTCVVTAHIWDTPTLGYTCPACAIWSYGNTWTRGLVK